MKTTFKKRWYLFIPLFFIAAAAFSYITMWLWNILLPVIFHFPVITFWQSLGLLILIRIIFGGFGGGYRGHGGRNFRHHIREKWDQMTPGERENFMKNHNYAHDWCGKSWQGDAGKSDDNRHTGPTTV